MWTKEDSYVEETIKNWEETKKEIRKKLPKIYKESGEEIKTIISMLVQSEYENAIKQDNEIRRNARNRNETTTKDINADNYSKENAEILKLIES
jgi:hypothetical protein